MVVELVQKPGSKFYTYHGNSLFSISKLKNYKMVKHGNHCQLWERWPGLHVVSSGVGKLVSIEDTMNILELNILKTDEKLILVNNFHLQHSKNLKHTAEYSKNFDVVYA